MAHQIVIGYASDSSEFVKVHDDNSPSQSGEGNNSLSVSSHSDWASSIFEPPVSSDSELELVDLASSNYTTYCQCEDEDFLVECLPSLSLALSVLGARMENSCKFGACLEICGIYL
jgi:hypothetical protein